MLRCSGHDCELLCIKWDEAQLLKQHLAYVAADTGGVAVYCTPQQKAVPLLSVESKTTHKINVSS